MVRLVDPDPSYADAYRAFIDDFGAEKRVPFCLSYPHKDMELLVARLRDQARGHGVRPGVVANSTFWMMAGAEMIGASNLRHTLTDGLKTVGGHIGFGIRPSARGRGHGKRILKLTLEKARAMVIPRALITCDKHNQASAGVIRANGGELASESYLQDQGGVVQRYWIQL